MAERSAAREALYDHLDYLIATEPGIRAAASFEGLDVEVRLVVAARLVWQLTDAAPPAPVRALPDLSPIRPGTTAAAHSHPED